MTMCNCYIVKQKTAYEMRIIDWISDVYASDLVEALIRERGAGYADPGALWRRSGLSAPALETLAGADAFGSIGLGRRQALWAVKRLGAIGSEAWGEQVGPTE